MRGGKVLNYAAEYKNEPIKYYGIIQTTWWYWLQYDGCRTTQWKNTALDKVWHFALSMNREVTWQAKEEVAPQSRY